MILDDMQLSRKIKMMAFVTLRHPIPESLLMLSWSLPGDPLPDIICLSLVSRSAPMENLCDMVLCWGPMLVLTVVSDTENHWMSIMMSQAAVITGQRVVRNCDNVG